jgi:outer membrane lipoprotein SlyB
MKFKVTFLVLASIFSLQAQAYENAYNKGGLGCGTIVSMRESTQKPIPSEIADESNVPRSSGGIFGQILANIPGVGILAAAAGDAVAGAVVGSAISRSNDADMAKQAEAGKYKNVQAIEFKFDDGEVVNIPVFVRSGLLYQVGKRLNAMVSPKYGSLTIGIGELFSSKAEIGDSNYNTFCRIDNAEARKAALAPFKNLVDESRIANASERRQVLAATVNAPAEALDAAIPVSVAPN